MADRMTLIRDALQQALQPSSLDVLDQSAAHAGHAGASAGGHFRVHVVSAAFTGKTMVQRHQLVYQALGELMRTDIHAVSIDARSPDEIEKPAADPS